MYVPSRRVEGTLYLDELRPFMRFFLHDYLGMADIDEEDVEALFCVVDLSNSADVGFAEFLWCARARTPARARLRFSMRALPRALLPASALPRAPQWVACA